jgi:hypothetical protein
MMSKMEAAGSKVLLRCQQLRLRRGFRGWCVHAARQRRMARAADKVVKRWINLALSPAMSRWMGYVEENKRLVRSADKVLLRNLLEQASRQASRLLLEQESSIKECQSLACFSPVLQDEFVRHRHPH